MDHKGILLFDIDGTLIKSEYGHRSSFAFAFKEVFGIEATIDEIAPSGMTDQQIILEVMQLHGFEENEIRGKMPQVLVLMVEHYMHIEDEISILPGVKALLYALKQDNYILGLVTGNIQAIGYSKLKRVGLDHFFSFGGFGSDSAVRSELIDIALKSLREQKDLVIDKSNVLIIGDTPRDVIAGNDAGVPVLGVTTGKYTADEIKEGGKCVIVKDLSNTKNTIHIINTLLGKL